jgi:hypothetical protein
MECREEELFMKVAVTLCKRTSRALGDVCTTSNLANMKTGQSTPTVSALPVRLQRLGGTTPSKPLSFSTACSALCWRSCFRLAGLASISHSLSIRTLGALTAAPPLKAAESRARK